MPLSPSRPDQQKLKPGVREKIDELRAQGHAIALASNQTYVASGKISFTCAEELMEDCAAKVGGVDTWRMSPPGYDHGR